MGKISLFFVFAVLSISLVSAHCGSGQVDINSASLEELDTLQGIGPAKAQAIVEARPFDSVDDLIDVTGIGEITLENIKVQGLACVDSEEDHDEDEKEEKLEGDEDKEDAKIEEIAYSEESNSRVVEEVQPQTITLNAEDKGIKTEESNEISNGRAYASYGLGIFSVLLCILFWMRERKYKNEFR